MEPAQCHRLARCWDSPMPLLFRLTLPLLLVLGIIGYALSPVVEHLVERWFQHDVELRSQLIFNTVGDSLTTLVRANAQPEIKEMFRRISEDERVLALGLCSPDGKLVVTSSTWPALIGCPVVSLPALAADTLVRPIFTTPQLASGAVLLSSFQLRDLSPGATHTLGTVLILHDLSFIERRSADTRFYLAGLLAFVGLVATGVTLLVARLTLRRWVRTMRNLLRPQGRDRDERAADMVEMVEMGPVVGEIRQLLRDLDMSKNTAEGIRVDWSPTTLRQVLDNELPGAEVIVVSNREPYIHNADADGTIIMQRPASGLV